MSNACFYSIISPDISPHSGIWAQYPNKHQLRGNYLFPQWVSEKSSGPILEIIFCSENCRCCFSTNATQCQKLFQRVDGKRKRTFVYFCLLLFTFVYFCLLLFTFVYFCLLLFTFVDRCKQMSILAKGLHKQVIPCLGSKAVAPRHQVSFCWTWVTNQQQQEQQEQQEQ
jgi:hypothetical protein